MEKRNLAKRAEYGFILARELYDSDKPFPLVQFVNDCLQGRNEVTAPRLIQVVTAYRNLVHLYGTREVDKKQGAACIEPAPF